jgi:tryptophanyl-tRNA synthetase
LFAIYSAFANAEQVAALRDRYAAGIGWGDMKQLLYETIDAELKDARTRYDALMQEPARIEEVLQAGAKKARAISAPFLQRLRHAVGLRPLQKG